MKIVMLGGAVALIATLVQPAVAQTYWETVGTYRIDRTDAGCSVTSDWFGMPSWQLVLTYEGGTAPERWSFGFREHPTAYSTWTGGQVQMLYSFYDSRNVNLTTGSAYVDPKVPFERRTRTPMHDYALTPAYAPRLNDMRRATLGVVKATVQGGGGAGGELATHGIAPALASARKCYAARPR
jgi:hypothetical protein